MGEIMLMVVGEHEELIEKYDLEGGSNAAMILMAVAEGLDMLMEPHDVAVYSSAPFGLNGIYLHGYLRRNVHPNENNYELKEKIRLSLEEGSHFLSNYVDTDIKTKIYECKVKNSRDSLREKSESKLIAGI